MESLLVNATVLRGYLNRAHGISEVIHVEIFEPSMRRGAVEVIVVKSEPISIVACVDEDSVRFARSHCVFQRRMARWFPVMSSLRSFRF